MAAAVASTIAVVLTAGIALVYYMGLLSCISLARQGTLAPGIAIWIPNMFFAVAGILMIADAVESASRTLSEPTPARIEGLVRDIIEKRLHDGQFDECGLTLREIGEIRESLIKSLIGIYHGRVKYPEQRSA